MQLSIWAHRTHMMATVSHGGGVRCSNQARGYVDILAGQAPIRRICCQTLSVNYEFHEEPSAPTLLVLYSFEFNVQNISAFIIYTFMYYICMYV